MSFVINEKTRQEIDHWIAKYPADQRRSAIVPALTLVQEQNEGWLSQEAMTAVADYLQVPAIYVYELATFYDLYELKPIGKHKIAICTNISCQLMGSEEVVAHFKKRLGVGLGETTADGKISLRSAECLADCDNAPMCQVDDKKCYSHLTPESIDKLLEKLG
ncbi:MAG TPA: NADH-quinone oxidoreductase subunit NuoE [Coxiellaceae bacterium]|nr:NADH-quinone oxidoreductase subunit NuoE [Coxiellaceae bacterium]